MQTCLINARPRRHTQLYGILRRLQNFGVNGRFGLGGERDGEKGGRYGVRVIGGLRMAGGGARAPIDDPREGYAPRFRADTIAGKGEDIAGLMERVSCIEYEHISALLTLLCCPPA